MVPDMGLRDACIAHDIEYWMGGSDADKEAADSALYAAVRARYGAVIASMYYRTVAVGGINHGYSPLPWRWGYGYPVGDVRASEERARHD
jgi:hypothetical protein